MFHLLNWNHEVQPRIIHPLFVSRHGLYELLVGGLVAMFYFPIYWVANHPNWRSYFSEGFKPPTRLSNWRFIIGWLPHEVVTIDSRSINWKKAWHLDRHLYLCSPLQEKTGTILRFHRICYSQFSKTNSCCFCVFISLMLAICWLLSILTLTSTCFECHPESWAKFWIGSAISGLPMLFNVSKIGNEWWLSNYFIFYFFGVLKKMPKQSVKDFVNYRLL